MSAIVWAACFLAPSDAIYAAFSELGDLLRKKGMELVLFGSEGDYSHYSGFRHYACPVLVGEHGRSVAFWTGSAKLPMGAGALDELIALDQAWGAPYSLVEAELYTLKGLSFWERAFELMQPSIILCWGTTLPFSRLLLRLAQQRQRPAYVIERGPLEGTLMLSLSGQTALTSANTLPSLIAPNLDDPLLAARWDAVANFYASSRERNYSSSNQIPEEDQLRASQDSEKARILFLGSFDIGSGCAFADPALGDIYGTWVKSSHEAALAVAKALTHVAPDAILLVKPHPACPFTLNQEEEGSVIVRDMSNLDVRYLMRSSDICVTLASTTQMLAFLEDCPIVTLGNGFLMGRDIAYDVLRPEHLPNLLQQALERQDWSRRLSDGRALLAAMFEQDLIGLEPHIPSKLKLDDLATLLGRFANYCPYDARSANDRIDDFQTFRFMARHDVTDAADQAERRMLALVRERDQAQSEVASWTARYFGAENSLEESLDILGSLNEEMASLRAAYEEAQARLMEEKHKLQERVTMLEDQMSSLKQSRLFPVVRWLLK